MENENEVPETQEVEAPEVTPETPEVKAEPSPATPKEPVQLSEEDQVRKRIDKIVWQREEARREREEERREVTRLRQELEQFKSRKQDTHAPVDPTRPNVNDPRFASYDEYTEALADWRARKVLQESRDEHNKRVQHESFQKATSTFNERAAKVREKYPDYDDLFESAPISEAMAPTILESENGPELAVYLAKNPDVARKLYYLTPTQAARELGKIEAKLDDLLQPKSVSEAKPPLSPVKPKGDLPDGLDDKLSPKEWQKRRAKQLGR